MANPNTIDFYRYQDIQTTDVSLKNQFENYFNASSYTEALALLTNNFEQIKDKAFTATTINKIIEGVLFVQNQYNNDTTVFLTNLAKEYFDLVDNFKNLQEWKNNINYIPYNFVNYNKKIYMCFKNSSKGTLPTNTEFWLEIGLQGQVGAPGTDVEMKFNWDSVIDYVPNDLVVYNKNIYVAIRGNSNKQPDISSEDWLLFLTFGNAYIHVGTTPPNNFVNDSIWIKTETDIENQNDSNIVFGEVLKYNSIFDIWDNFYPSTIHTQISGSENLILSGENIFITIHPSDWKGNQWTYTYDKLKNNTTVDIMSNNQLNPEQQKLYNGLTLSFLEKQIILTKVSNTIESVELPIILKIY